MKANTQPAKPPKRPPTPPSQCSLPATEPPGPSAPSGEPQPAHRGHERLLRGINLLVLVLSVLLIVFISYDTFKGVAFLQNRTYMRFQLFVCVVFLMSFMVEWYLADERLSYLGRRWLFFLLSIPYLNIIDGLHYDLGPEALYWLRFIPLARGALAITIIVGYFTRRRITSVFVTYTVILLLVVYFCSLIIFEREQPVNPQIGTFGQALWFACMQVTTIGCDTNPLTLVGKLLQVLLAFMGMVMFPLFTVFITQTVMRFRQRAKVG